MSESETFRRENMGLALRLMIQDLGEPYEWQKHNAKAPKFVDVLHTTWDELAEHGSSKPRRSPSAVQGTIDDRGA